MYVKEMKGRKYFVCDRCKKPYSFRSGKFIRSGMESFCRDCAPASYPYLPKKRMMVKV